MKAPTRLLRRLGLEPPDRHAAEREASGAVAGQRVVAVGYHGQPMLRRTHWEWQIPLYFFAGGLAGASYLIAAVADVLGSDDDREVVAVGRRLALAGLTASVPLLIADLKRPERFLNMLRTFKPSSPMSVGAWALFLFGPFVGLGVLPLERRLGRVLGLLGAPIAGFVASYTGVLLATTAVPLWGRARAWLGPLFFCSACSSALAALGLLVRGVGARRRLHELETLALAGELATLAAMLRAAGPLARPLIGRPFGQPFWALGVAGGLVAPLWLRGPVRGALVLGGGLLLRFLLVEAGKRSADDPQAAYLYHR
ncbi:MAG TPA: NrfD/PsrC family molybdoenzyme membrane anchor subunit [Chloroflexota bacterium]|nr:NrfD/PsrC family molybdoenzyme membrane anchor subunit [Chloroflexota bacterium]